MSDLHVDLTRQDMEESGELDFIRAHAAAAQAEARGEAPPDPAPAPEADTEAEGEDSDEVEDSADSGIEPEPESEEEDVLYLDLDEDTQALLDTKYGGDLNKMLAAAREAQSLIGRQGNELGELKKELDEWRQGITNEIRAAQPYPEWPDEFDEGPAAAAKLRAVSEAAFARGDVQMFQTALGAWEEADPVSAGLYRDLKEMQIAQSMLAQEASAGSSDETADLERGLEKIREKYPQFADEAFQAEVGAELDRTPSLKAVLWNGIPGVTVSERLDILDEAAQRVAQRLSAETERKARKRIAVRVSEEARAERVAAQVARGGTARGNEPEAAPRTVPLGETGKVLDLDRLNAMLDPGDRI